MVGFRVAIALVVSPALLMLAACDREGEPSAAKATVASAPVQSPTTTGPLLRDDVASFVAQPALLPGVVQALPRVVGNSDAVRAINTDLKLIDGEDAQLMTACRSEGGSWSRDISNPMIGPGYLTFRIAQEYDCGGPYPASSNTFVTYELANGRRLDWASAIPGLHIETETLDDPTPGYVANVRSTVLARWYSKTILKDGDPDWLKECRFPIAEMAPAQSFHIWADPERGGVSVFPDFPHVSQACADTATLTETDLRGFGANPRLISALATARTAQLWAPNEKASTQ